MNGSSTRREVPRRLRRGQIVAIAALVVASLAVPGPSQASQTFTLASTIAFGSTRDNPTGNPFLTAEVYLINPDGTNPRRLTDNAYGDTFPTLSPDGKKIVFDSNRLTAGRVCDGSFIVGDLFLMNTDGTEQTLLTRGDSASWSRDGKTIAFHASASYYASGGLETGCPIVPFPGGAASDSDIFVVNVDDLLAGTEQPTNMTNSPNKIDDDADWSPDGQKLVFTNRDANDPDQLNPLSAEIYVMNVDDKGMPTRAPERLTFNDYEERGPAWSPDNSRIVYSCRVGPVNPAVGYKSFRICVINADGTGWQQLTNETDSMSDLTATWSPDGQQIVFHRTPRNQLFIMTQNPDGTWSAPTQLTFPPGINLLANWGELRVKV